jgi:hypothetical protein
VSARPAGSLGRAVLALALVLGILVAPILPASAADDPPPVDPPAAGPTVTLLDAAGSPDGAFVAGTTRVPPVTASGAATYTTDGEDVCEPTADGAGVVLHLAGTCRVTATVAGTDDEDPADTATDTRDYPVAHAPRTIAIAAPTTTLVATTTWTPVVTFPTGELEDDEDVVLTTDDQDVCRPGATAGTIELLTAEPCTVTATVADGAVYAGADDDIEVVPAKKAQSVSLSAPTSTVAGVPWLPTVDADTDGVPSFDTEDDTVCTPADDGASIVLLLAGGECRATATVPGDLTYEEGTSTTVAFTVTPRPVDVVVTASSPRRYRGTFTIIVTATDEDDDTAPGTSIDGPGTILVGDETATAGTDGPEDVVFVDGKAERQVTGPRPGEVDVAVTIEPTPAASYGLVEHDDTVDVDPAEQSVAFTTPPAPALVGDEWEDAALLTPATEPGGGARVAVVESDDTDVCTVAPGTASVTFVGAGTCPLRASHPGDDDYDPADEVDTEVEVSLRPVKILYTVTPTPVPGTSPVHGDEFTVTARAVDGVDGLTAIAGTGTLTVTEAGTAGAAVTATPWTSSVDVVGVGGHTHTASVTFDATDPAYAPYAGGDTATVVVERAEQSLAWATGDDAPPTTGLAGEDWTPVVVRGETDAEVVLDTVDDDVCDVSPTDDGTIVFLAAGRCEVTASQDGDVHYLDAEIDTEVEVVRRPVSVTVTLSDDTPVFGDTITADATVADDGDATLELDGTGVLTAPGIPGSGATLTYVDGVAQGVDLGPLPVVTGTVVTATFVPTPASAGVYAGDSGTTSLTVSKAPQVIEPPDDLDTDVAVGEEVEVLAGGGPSGNPVTGHPVAGSPGSTASCSVVNPTVAGQPVVVTFDRPVDCTVELRQAAGPNHAAATPVPIVFTVSRRPVRVIVSTAPDPVYYDDQVEVTVRVVDDGPGGGPAKPAPGTVAVVVPGVSGVVTTTRPTEGSTTVAYRVPVAGVQELDVTFVPTDTDRFAPITATDPASQQQVVSRARPQAVVFDDATIPSPAWASRTWTVPLSGTAGGGGFTLEPRADTDGEEHCTVSGLVVRFSSEGDCILDAYQDAVTGRYERSPARRITVDVDAIGYRVRLRQPEQGQAGVPLAVSALSRDLPFGTVVAGTGEVTLERRTGPGPDDWTAVPGARATGPWTGGILALVATPPLAGTYRVAATFTPDDAPAYRFDGTVAPSPATFEVFPGPQVVEAVGAPTTASVLDRWVVTTRGGGSPNPVVASLHADSEPGACVITGPERSQVVEFTAPGRCVVDLVQAGDESYAEGRLTEPLRIDVSAATPLLEVVDQTVAQPVVGVEHRVTLRSTSPTSGRPIPGRFVLTTDRGEVRRVPDGPLTAATAVDTATFGFVLQTAGALQIDVNFEPLDTTGVTTATIDVPLDVLPGTQRVSVATAPPSNESYVGDEWDPAATVHGPPGAVAIVTVVDPVVGGVTQPPRCRWNSTTRRVDLVAAGTCTVTVTAPSVPGGHWVDAEPVTRSFEVAVNATSLTVAVVIPVPGRSQAWVDEQVVVRAESFGVDGATRVPLDATLRLTVTDVDGGTPRVVERDVTSTVTEVPLTIATAARYTVTAELVPDDTARWASTSTVTPLEVVRRPQTLAVPTVPTVPVRLPALTTWTSPVTTSSGIAADVTSETTDVCTATGRQVRMLSSGECRLVFSVPDGNTVYVDVDEVVAVIPVTTNTTALALPTPASGRVGVEQPLVATVTAPVPTPVDGTNAVATPGVHRVDGQVVFTAATTASGNTTRVEVDRVPVSVVAGVPVTATGSWTPAGSTRTGQRSISAELVLDDPAAGATPVWVGASAGPRSVAVERGTADLDLTVTRVAPGPDPDPDAADRVRLTADLGFGGDVPPGIVSGTVRFSSREYVFDEEADVEVVVGADGSARAVAEVVTTAVPASARVTMNATYSGNDDVEGDDASVVRDVPVVDLLDDDVPAGWQTAPVTFRYRCTSASPLVEPCPTAVTLDTDGSAVRRSFAVVAADGGTRYVQTPVVAIDRTRPRVAVQGIADGSTFDGLAPGPRCQASDATSGLRSCTLSTRRLDRLRRQVTARATDAAGNVSTLTVSYRELQEWVVGAPRDAADRFAVRPGARIRVETITQGARRKPQLVALRAGSWKPVATMVAWRQRDGAYTWYAFHRLPAGWRPSARLGVRVGTTVRPLGLTRR